MMECQINKIPISEDSSVSFFQELQIEFLIHELKDPLSIIETGLRTLMEKKEKYGSLSSRQERILQRSLRNTKKARIMLYDLLEIGRSQSGCYQCSCFYPAKVLYEVLIETLEIMAVKIYERCKEYRNYSDILEYLSRSGIFLNITSQLLELEIIQDEIKFRQIVGNLIKNALHYRKERIELFLKHENNMLFIEVTDDGPGIASEHHQMIFQRYAQVKVSNELCTLQRRSHGLGLAGARILARYLDGDIEVNSDRGKGATFRFILPLNGQGE